MLSLMQIYQVNMVGLRNKTIFKGHTSPGTLQRGKDYKLGSIFLYVSQIRVVLHSQWVKVHCFLWGESRKVNRLGGWSQKTSSLGPWSLPFFPCLRRAALIRHLLAIVYHIWPVSTTGNWWADHWHHDQISLSAAPWLKSSAWDQALCCKRGALPSPTSSLSRKRECERQNIVLVWPKMVKLVCWSVGKGQGCKRKYWAQLTWNFGFPQVNGR